MKRFSQVFLIFLFGVSVAINTQAQITIPSTNFALSTTARDSSAVKWMNKTGAVLPTHGNNQIWDYSAFRDTLPNVYYLGNVTQPVTARPSAFASANLEAQHNYFFQNFPIFPQLFHQK